MKVIPSHDNIPATNRCDYENVFLQEKLKYLASDDWDRCVRQFLKTLKSRVSPADVEGLKNFLREEKRRTSDIYEKTESHIVYNQSLSKDGTFDSKMFMEKYSFLLSRKLKTEDLADVLHFICIQENIDNIFNSVVNSEQQHNSPNTINVMIQDLYIMNGDIIIPNTSTAGSREEDDEEVLHNYIFVEKLFDSNAKLNLLKTEIGSSIDLKSYNPVFGKPDKKRIDPSNKNEWYYIYKAIKESGVAVNRFSVSEFLDQMISWFPISFDNIEALNELDKKKEMYRNYEKSISHEKKYWKTKDGTVVPIKDMTAKCKILGLDGRKVERVFGIAYELLTELRRIKAKIESEKNNNF